MAEGDKLRVIVLGFPGVGKGTISKHIEHEYGLHHISTGDIFREKTKENSLLGKQIKELIDKGNFVPDEITTKIVLERIEKDDCANGYILDGFPRTLKQAEDFHKKESVEIVMLLDADEKKIIDRLSGRLTCPKGHVYHIRNVIPKKKGICDKDGEKLIRRADEDPKIVKQRMVNYDKQTKPLLDFYQKKHKELIHHVDANKEINELFKEVDEILEFFV